MLCVVFTRSASGRKDRKDEDARLMEDDVDDTPVKPGSRLLAAKTSTPQVARPAQMMMMMTSNDDADDDAKCAFVVSIFGVCAQNSSFVAASLVTSTRNTTHWRIVLRVHLSHHVASVYLISLSLSLDLSITLLNLQPLARTLLMTKSRHRRPHPVRRLLIKQFLLLVDYYVIRSHFSI